MAVMAHAAASDLPISWKLLGSRGFLAGGLWYKLHIRGAGVDYSSRSSNRSIKKIDEARTKQSRLPIDSVGKISPHVRRPITVSNGPSVAMCYFGC